MASDLHLADLDSIAILRRFRVIASVLQIPSDLAEPITRILAAHAGAQEARQLRDQHIAMAAALCDSAKSTRQKAEALLAESLVLDRCWSSRHEGRMPQLGTLRGELHAARLIQPLPSSERQFRNILARYGKPTP